MHVRTHHGISARLVGEPIEVDTGQARCRLQTTDEMRADDHGLVHGGFVFGLADYAAMLAVNDPNVVLGGADVRFLAPVSVGQQVIATATASGDGKKRTVEVIASIESAGTDVFRGTFTCFVLDKHVLDRESQ